MAGEWSDHLITHPFDALTCLCCGCKSNNCEFKSKKKLQKANPGCATLNLMLKKYLTFPAAQRKKLVACSTWALSEHSPGSAREKGSDLTKTKVMTLTNHKRHRQYSEPITFQFESNNTYM